MNETPDPREQLYARVTAWVLGELSPAEAAAMAERVKRDRELERLAKRVRHTIGLLRAASKATAQPGVAPSAPAEPMQLDAARREKLLAHFKTVPLPQAKIVVADTGTRSRVWSRVIGYSVAAACVLLMASLLLPSLSKAKAKAMRVTAASIEKQRELEERLAELDRGAAAPAKPRFATIELPAAETSAGFAVTPQDAQTGGAVVNHYAFSAAAGKTLETRVYQVGPKGFVDAIQPMSGTSFDQEMGGGVGGGGGDVNRFEPAPASSAPPIAGQSRRLVAPPMPVAPQSAPAYRYDSSSACSDCGGPATPPTPVAAPARPQVAQDGYQNGVANAPTLLPPITAESSLRRQAMKPESGEAKTLSAGGSVAGAVVNGRRFDADFRAPSGQLAMGEDKSNLAHLPAGTVEYLSIVADPLIVADEVAQRKFASGDVDGRGLVGSVLNKRVEELERAPRPSAANAPLPQPEVLAADNAFSTFSLNVSDVSFKLAAASLAQGRMPDAATVRTEEFLNAFDYRDPEPAPGAPLAFAWERARSPFAHNRDLLRFSLKTAALGRAAGQRMNLVLVLDNSGSMERADRVQIIQRAMQSLGGLLNAADRVSVVGFARTATVWLDGVAGNQTVMIVEAATGRTPQGGTNLEEALRIGYATALRHYIAGGINHVVLLTDGAANLGNVNPAQLQNAVETHRRQGIALDCFGIGWEGFNDDLLEVLARNGDGRYGFINSPAEAESEFAAQLCGALHVAASDVKVQVEFNPQRVTAWRQFGYAKHQLTKEQFRDNTVDAAELSAKEAGNALYTVEVNPTGAGPLATVRARFKVPGTQDYREQAWEVPFTGGAPALDQSTATMRLAAGAGAFAEWLVASPFAAEVTLDALSTQMRNVPDVFGVDPRPRLLETMIQQAKSLGGR